MAIDITKNADGRHHIHLTGNDAARFLEIAEADEQPGETLRRVIAEAKSLHSKAPAPDRR